MLPLYLAPEISIPSFDLPLGLIKRQYTIYDGEYRGGDAFEPRIRENIRIIP